MSSILGHLMTALSLLVLILIVILNQDVIIGVRILSGEESLILFFGVGHSLFAKLAVPLNITWPPVELAA